MTDESSSSSTPLNNNTTSPPVVTELPDVKTPPTVTTTWALPAGIEDDIEQALIKTTVGALAGGIVGLICFKGGKGTRAASIATGIGAGLGSTWERVKFRYEQQQEQENK